MGVRVTVVIVVILGNKNCNYFMDHCSSRSDLIRLPRIAFVPGMEVDFRGQGLRFPV